MNNKTFMNKRSSMVPLYFFAVAIVIIFATEALVMTLLQDLLLGSLYREVLLDSTILSVVVVPALYLLLVRPMHRYLKERNHTIVEMRKLSNAVEQGPVSIVITDLSGNIEYVNSKFIEITGYTSEEVIGQNPRVLKTSVHKPSFYKNLWSTLTAGKVWRGEFCNKKKSGELYWEEATISPVTDSDGRITSYMAVKRDITKSKKAEEALKVSEKKYRLVHDTAFDGIIITDTDSNILEYNRSAEKMFGYDEGELERKNLTELIPKELRERHLVELQRFCDTGKSQDQAHIVELQGLRKNREVFPIEIILNSFELHGKILLTGTIRDITERKNSEESIKHLAYYDHLTGLPNRLLFIDRLDQVLLREAWKQGTAAVLFLDLDRFKIVNDTLGHVFGDELLKVVARRLEGCLREGDTVARFGGDEFTIMLQGLAKTDDVMLVLEKILNTIKLPVEINGQEIIIGTSIGVSIYPDDGYDSDTLIKNADIAMYRAKSEGKNSFQLYTTSMTAKANNLLNMEYRLRKALENDDFVVHYQPQLDLRNNRLIGMEALIRLAGQEDGRLMSPGTFIPVAEETGLIIPLSKWVFKTTCRQNKIWQDAGYPPVTVAVNASPKVFKQKNFVPMVIGILDETGLNPEYLEIEVTEETMMGNTDETVEKMKALRDIGVRFAIDDFGTGYSSLSYIKMLPIETLKIDKAFISDLNNNADDKAIVTAIIQMAHSMGIEVLAEGVESDEQLELISSLGCDKLQGYLYGKPVPCNEFEQLLEKAQDVKELKNTA